MLKFTYRGIYRGRVYRSLLKNLGSLFIKYITNMYNTYLNTNTILHFGKGAPTISILKPKKTQHWFKLSIHITFITHCQSIRESVITINNRKHSSYFSSIWIQIIHSTYTALHNICHQITKCFNNPRLDHTVAVALDMSKAFNSVNKNKPTYCRNQAA